MPRNWAETRRQIPSGKKVESAKVDLPHEPPGLGGKAAIMLDDYAGGLFSILEEGYKALRLARLFEATGAKSAPPG